MVEALEFSRWLSQCGQASPRPTEELREQKGCVGDSSARLRELTHPSFPGSPNLCLDEHYILAVLGFQLADHRA